MVTERENQYEVLRLLMASYWSSYGGWKSICLSPLFHIAIIITWLVYPSWGAHRPGFIWFDLPLSIIPNMLGFTLAAYAALVSFGSKNFLEIMSGQYSDGKESPFSQTSAAFFHFIFIQLWALLIAIILKAYEVGSGLLAGFGVFMFIYAVLTGLGAAFAVLNMTKLFDGFVKMLDEERNRE